MTAPPKRRPAEHQPTQAELDEPLTIDATPEQLGAAIMSHQPPDPVERSDD